MLNVEQLSLVRGGRCLFAGLSFELGAGQALRVQGPNGSGKTSLLRTLAGLAEPQAGRLAWRGLPLAQADGARRLGSDLAWLGHDDGLDPDFDAHENLALTLALAGEPQPRAAIDRALGSMGLALPPRQPVRALSRGQQRRVALARFALTRKPLWIVDEPLSALDSDGRAAFADLTHRHLLRGGLLLAACHHPPWLPPASTRSLQLSPTAPPTRH